MINLIPPRARKQVIREYWVRVVSVWFVLLGTTFLIIAILDLPLLVLVDQQKGAYATSYGEAADLSAEFEAAQETFAATNATARLLARGGEPVTFSAYIDALEELRGASVTIEELRFGQESTGALAGISVVGEASTRQALASFRDRIEAHALFTAVELPISNLAKDEDIRYSIKVTPAVPTPL